jgi:ubiquinone/menaquinone biosynthesis C-methylase UbiE
MSVPFDYDAELVRYQERLSAAVEVRPDDEVLDVGCGTGLTTREAAKAARSGSALGVEISADRVATARRLSEQEGVRNVRFEQADVQVYPFEAARFSVGMSRFGTMFFAEPALAFANIARALRPGARLVQLVWGEQKDQEWVGVVRDALAGGRTAPVVSPAFSLADPAVAEQLLIEAGFGEVQFVDVREPVYYGSDPEAACAAIRSLQMGQDLLEGQDPDQAYQRLLEVLAARETGEGVWFDSRAWIVTAVKPVG